MKTNTERQESAKKGWEIRRRNQRAKETCVALDRNLEEHNKARQSANVGAGTFLLEGKLDIQAINKAATKMSEELVGTMTIDDIKTEISTLGTNLQSMKDDNKAASEIRIKLMKRELLKREIAGMPDPTASADRIFNSAIALGVSHLGSMKEDAPDYTSIKARIIALKERKSKVVAITSQVEETPLAKAILNNQPEFKIGMTVMATSNRGTRKGRISGFSADGSAIVEFGRNDSQFVKRTNLSVLLEDETAHAAKIAGIISRAKVVTERKVAVKKGLGICLCGCGGQAVRQFLQGHDARVKGILLRVYMEKAVPASIPQETRQAWKGVNFIVNDDRLFDLMETGRTVTSTTKK